jgi:aspartyl protease family protein
MVTNRFSKSLGLAFLMTVGAGLPGLKSFADTQAPVSQLFVVTELDANENNQFVTDADINGRSVKVLVDTGATAVALSYEDADRIGLRPRGLVFDVPIQTANGPGKAARVKLDKVKVKGVTVRDVDGMVLQKGALKGTLLGMSFLSRLRSFAVQDGKLVLEN